MGLGSMGMGRKASSYKIGDKIMIPKCDVKEDGKGVFLVVSATDSHITTDIGDTYRIQDVVLWCRKPR